MNRNYEEEILVVGYRLTECVSYLDEEKRKTELILLLDKLNKLNDLIVEDYNKFASSLDSKNLNQKECIIEVHSFGYATGRINLLKNLINSLINKLNDAERIKEVLQNEDEIIKKSKQDEDINYMG